MVTIVYNELTQYNIEVEGLTEEEVNDMDEEDVKNLINDMIGTRLYEGEIKENEHHINQYEVLNDNNESIKCFEESYD